MRGTLNDVGPCADAAGSERVHHGPFGWQPFGGLKHASLFGSYLRSTWYYRARLAARVLGTDIVFSKKVKTTFFRVLTG